MYAVFDIGGTNSRIGVSQTGEGLEFVDKWPSFMDFDRGVEEMVAKMHELSNGKPLSGIALGAAGVLDKSRRKFARLPHLPGWENKPLAKVLEEKTGAKVILENDSAIAGLGEAVRGAGRRFEIVAYLTVSTGIGGARIVEGKIDRKTWGFEPGHQIIDVQGEVGYWEDFASGSAMEKVHSKKPWEIVDSQIWEDEARLLAIGLNNVIVMWSPEVVILGGSMMKGIDLEKVKGFLGEQMRIFPTLPEIKLAELGDKSGLFGALELLRGSNV